MLVCLASDRDERVVRMDETVDRWVSGRDDRESKIFYLFRSAESSENALTSEIPVYNIFTHK
jgi:hypothetical protein